MPQITINAIAPQLEDELTRASIELATHLEDAASSIASHVFPPSFENIRPGLRNVALDVVESFKQSAFKALEQTTEMGQILLRMKADLKRKEYQILLKELGYTGPRANKLIALAKTFDGFNLWQLAGVSINTLFALCTKTYASVVEQMRSTTGLTTEAVEAIMKGARPPKKPKQKQEQVELKQDPSGGGRHLEFNFYDDEVIAKINKQVETEQITRQAAVSIAFKRSEKLEQVQQQHIDAIAEVRDTQIEMQRQLIQKDECISDLTQQIVKRDREIKELKISIADPTSAPILSEKPSMVMTSVRDWEDVARLVNCDRDIFLATMKTWSVNQKETLPALLAEHIETNYPECLENLGWVPDKLRDAALKRISFAVQKIVGADNLHDEPELKTFYDCKFVSLKDFGTRQERWLFETPDGKKLPAFGRDEFNVNRF